MSASPLQVAVVGSGPAGFYAADALLKSEEPVVEVDVLDRLPTPWGLVRLGVAPDHENIKAVSRAFEKTASRPGFRFFGNVEVGSTVSHEELLRTLRRCRLHGRGPDRPPPRHSRRGPAGLLGGHGVRRLVQRPPRLPRPHVRPVSRAGGGGRERKRRDRLRPDARAHRGGARADGHDARSHRVDPGGGRPGDRDARPPGAGAGRVHSARS